MQKIYEVLRLFVREENRNKNVENHIIRIIRSASFPSVSSRDVKSCRELVSLPISTTRDGNGYKPAGFYRPKPVPVKNIYAH